MWYYCRSSDFPADLAPAFGSGTIATATSSDGVRWQRVEGPLERGAVFAPSLEQECFDAGHVATGDVIGDGAGWLMAYFAGNDEMPGGAAPIHTAKGYLLRIGLARSDDGVEWRRVTGSGKGGATIDVAEGDAYAAFPSLLSVRDRHLLYYTTVDTGARFWQQRIAVSDDGENWRSDGILPWIDEPREWEGGGIVTRDVLPNPLADDPPWLMVYTARDGRSEANGRRSVGVAVSEDAITWRRAFRDPVFVVGPEGAWDHAGVAVPRLVVTDDQIRLYYYGWSDESCDGHPQRGIGLAVAPKETPWRLRRVLPNR